MARDRALQALRQHESYVRNKVQIQERRRVQRRQNRKFIIAVKLANPCACGETHVACLEFHHKDGEQKELNVSRAVRNYGLARLKAEIAKCEIHCANCHRKMHFNSDGSKK